MGSERKHSLTTLAMGGVVAGVGGKIANLVIGIGSVAILARLLSPLEYGYFGLVSICLAISQLVPQSISNAIVQQKDTDHSDHASAFSLVLITAGISSVMLIAFRHEIGAFFGDAPLSAALIYAAFILPFMSISAYWESMIAKRFEFKRNALIDFLSTLSGQTILTIALAYFGFGVWSLLLGTGLTTLIKLSMQLSTGLWRDMRYGRVKLPFLSRVGWFLVLSIFNYLGRNADNIIVGKMLGSEMLGIYQRAFNLMMRPVHVVGSVTTGVLYPLMASVQNDLERMRSAYLKSLTLTSLVGIPMSLVLYVHGYEIVVILFGMKWLAVVEPFKILVLALFFRLAYRITETTAFAVGAMGAATMRQALYAAAIILGAAIGSQWGLTGVAVGVALALLFFYFLSAVFVNSLLGAPMASFIICHVAGALIALLGVIPTLLFRDQIASFAGPFGVLAMGGVAVVLSYTVVMVFRHSLMLDPVSVATLDDLTKRVVAAGLKLQNRIMR